MVNSFDVKWEYCDVGPVHDACDEGDNGAPSPHTLTPLSFGEWVDGDVYEHMYVYYSIEVSASLQALEVVIVPESGDPDMYVSFDNRFPTGHNYSYVQDDVAVDIFRITRGTFGFCGAKGTAAGGKVDPNAACTLYVSVTGFEASTYHIVAYDVSDPKANHACADGCNWKSLGDGECQPQCNVAACYFDRGDCTRGPDATHCRADCTREWLDDGYCDEACFNANCNWDRRDCLDKGHAAARSAPITRPLVAAAAAECVRALAQAKTMCRRLHADAAPRWRVRRRVQHRVVRLGRGRLLPPSRSRRRPWFLVPLVLVRARSG
jgi:hypothetical protein